MPREPDPTHPDGEMPINPTRQLTDKAPQAQYDPTYHQRHVLQINKRVQAIIRNLPPCERVLDIGCNIGYFSRAVLDHGRAFFVDAVEPERNQVDPNLLSDDRFTLYEGDIVDFDFPAPYSAIIYCAVHHHVFGHRGFLQAFKLWRRIVDGCDRHIFFETGHLLEGSRWYWQRAIRRYYSSDEEHIGALLEAVGPRLEGVKVIFEHRIHKTRRWLLRIDLLPKAPRKPPAGSLADSDRPAYRILETCRRTVGSRGQQLVPVATELPVSSRSQTPDGRQIHQGVIFSRCERVDTGEPFWCKKNMADPCKDEREHRIGNHLDDPLFVRSIDLHPEVGLVFPFVDGERLSEVDLDRVANKVEVIHRLIDIFEKAGRTRVVMGDLDFDPRKRGTSRSLVDIVDMHPSNILVQRDGLTLRISAVIDFEYYRNHNRARNAEHLAKIIVRSGVRSTRAIRFLGEAIILNLRHHARWATAPVEERLYDHYTARPRKWFMWARETIDRFLRPIRPGHWQ